MLEIGKIGSILPLDLIYAIPNINIFELSFDFIPHITVKLPGVKCSVAPKLRLSLLVRFTFLRELFNANQPLSRAFVGHFKKCRFPNF